MTNKINEYDSSMYLNPRAIPKSNVCHILLFDMIKLYWENSML